MQIEYWTDKAARMKELFDALNLLRSMVDEKTCDAIDNDGKHYQSAALAGAISNAHRVLGKHPKQ